MKQIPLGLAAVPAVAVAVGLLVTGCATVDGHHANHGSSHAALHPVATVEWLEFEEGQRRARAEGKLMVVDFYVSEGCHRCEVMDQEVYGQPAIAQRLNHDFVPVRVHLDRGIPAGAKELGKRYDFNFDCLLVVADADGNAVRDASSGRMCFADAVDVAWFAAYLDQASGKAPDEDFFADM